MSRFVVMFAVLAVLLASSCGVSEEPDIRLHVPSGAHAGDVDITPCVHIARGVEYAAECGTLIVPENRSESGSRMIAIPFKRILAPGSSTAEPIFYLTGGPGQSNMDYSRVEWFHDQHDIVLVGYRGVDGSVFLGCPEVTEAMGAGLPLMSVQGMQAQTSAYGACAERLQREGVDLAGYTVLEVVDDIEAVRSALGYESINLESGSFGTRLALIYSWKYPERVFRNAMVAVNPPGRFWWDPEILDDQMRRYAELCAQDEYCSSRTGDLYASMQIALDNIPDRWLVFPVDRDAVLFATFMGLYSVESAAATLDVWIAAADGDYSGMALVTAALTFMLPADFAWGDSASKALSADYDFDPETDYVAEVTPGPSLIGSPGSSMGWAAAPSWPANKIPEEFRVPQSSTVETLMLSGSLDVSTPARNARNQLLPMMENAEQVVLAEFAHTGDLLYLQPDASRHLLETFYSTGEVDASRFVTHRVNFQPDWGFPLLAKLFVAAAIVVPVIAILLGVLCFRLARRYRHRRRSMET